MDDLIIIGAGDFGREIVNLVNRINGCNFDKAWNIVGFVDDNPDLQGKVINGVEVIGNISSINSCKKSVYVICSIGSAKKRKEVIESICNPMIKYAVLIDPCADIYSGADISEGCVVCGGTILAIDVKLGKHVVVNLNCNLGHDVIVDDYCVLNPGTIISGKCNIKECSDLGTGTSVIQGLTIGPNTVIGAGAVVIRDIQPNCMAAGNPAIVKKTFSN